MELDQLRLIEALIFASAQPIEEAALAARLPDGADLNGLLSELERQYALRGVILVRRGTAWAFRTAPDLAWALRSETDVSKKLTRAALETLAIIAYHQPVTRAEIEDIRGVALSKGTLDSLFEAGWVRPKGRRRSPGRPLTWATTPAFLDHFGLESVEDLPGVEELKASGLLDARPAAYTNRAGESGPAVDVDPDPPEEAEPLELSLFEEERD